MELTPNEQKALDAIKAKPGTDLHELTPLFANEREAHDALKALSRRGLIFELGYTVGGQSYAAS